MEKLKIAFRLYGKGQGNPTDSYIITNDMKKYYRVSIDDAVELCERKYLLASLSPISNCLLAKYKFESIKVEKVGSLKYTKADDIISLMVSNNNIIKNSKIDKVREITTVRQNNRGTILADIAIIERDSDKLVGYIFSDGKVFRSKDIEGKYQKQITQHTNITDDKELKNMGSQIDLSAGVYKFKLAYGNDFNIQYNTRRGIDSYMFIPLKVKKYTSTQAQCMLNSGEIKKIVYTDNIDEIKHMSENMDIFNIADMLGYNKYSKRKSNKKCIVYNDKISYKYLILTDINESDFIYKVNKEKANKGVLLGENEVAIYDVSDKKVTIISKKEFYRSVIVGDVPEIEGLKIS